MDLAAENFIYLITGIGLFLAGAMPLLARYSVISTAMGLVGFGFLAGLLPVPMPGVLPQGNEDLIERVTEVTVIVALMGVGLSLDRPLSRRGWASTGRLVLIAMPLCIAGVALLGWSIMGLTPAAAVLLGAVLAPTDPVLAADVQVAEPNSEGDEDEVRFSLTSEAGLNDGLAFPFVYAAIFLAGAGAGAASDGDPAGWIARWVAWELVGKTLIAVAAGVAIGYAFAWVTFEGHRPWLRLAEANEGMVALAATFVAYGLTEVLGGWGFLAVFVTAVAMRRYEQESEYHRELHSVTHQVERLLTLATLLLFGVACATGLLSDLTWQGAVVAALLVLVVRPLCGWLSMLGGKGPRRERWAISFFGVRGIGSFYYLAYASGEASFSDQPLLWSTVSFTVLLSVLLHGATASPAMDRLDALRGRGPAGARVARASA